MSIRRMLIAAAAVGIVVFAVSTAFLVVFSARSRGSEEDLAFMSEVRQEVNVLAALSTQFAISPDDETYRVWMDSLIKIQDYSLQLDDLTGPASMHYSRVVDNLPSLQSLGDQLRALPRAQGVADTNQIDRARQEHLLSQIQVTLADTRGAAVAANQLILRSSFQNSSNLRTVFWSVLGVFTALIACFVVSVWVVALKPLARLELGVGAVGSGDLSHRVGTKSSSEIGRLGRAFDDMTENLQAITVSRDALEVEVSRRVAAEEAQQAALEDLKRSNRDLEQFAYVASHDLQEPLRMVATYTQLLAQRYREQLDDKADKYIAYAVDGATRMQQLIDDLLTYSRIGTRGRPPEMTDSRKVLDEALANLAAVIEETSADVRVDELPRVKADAIQLMQLFQNLVANALKFRGDARPCVHVRAQRRGSEWLFSIEDNGIGIEAKHSERVFTIFQRLHTRAEYPGSGIGLALCKRIVERHGGRIWFESEQGSGSTFFFTLPDERRFADE